MTFTLSQEQYEALVALAKAGATTPDRQRALNAWLITIELENSVVRHRLWIQWQEADQPLPPTAQFPESWPPELRYDLEILSRPIGKADVDAVLRKRARNPITVLVTPDPGAVLGWTPVEDYFTQ